MRKIKILLISLLLYLPVVVFADARIPQFIEGDTKILFSSSKNWNNLNEEDHTEVYVIDIDGLNLKKLTNSDRSAIGVAATDDGGRIAIHSSANYQGNNFNHDSFSYVLSSLDNSLRQVADTECCSDPLKFINSGQNMLIWSPSNLTGDNPLQVPQLYTASLDGSNKKLLTNFSDSNYKYATNGDGKIVLFYSKEDLLGTNPNNIYQFYVMELPSANFRQLSNFDNNFWPSMTLSNDGQFAAFAGQVDITGENSDRSWEIFTLNITSGEIIQLTNIVPTDSLYDELTGVKISSDNLHILFSGTYDLEGSNTDRNFELFEIATDGTGFTQLTNNDRVSFSPNYSSDNNLITFVSEANLNNNNPDNEQHIFLMDRNGENIRQITPSYKTVELDDLSTPYFMQKILPLHHGNRWYYDYNSQPALPLEPLLIGGLHVIPISFPGGGKLYFYNDALSFSYLGFSTPNVITNIGQFSIDVKFDNRLNLISDNMSFGESWPDGGSGTVYISPTYGLNSLKYSGKVTFDKDVTITVPAGTFDTVYSKLDFTYTTTIEGLSIAIRKVFELWMAPEIGIVKLKEDDQSINLSSSNTLQLQNETSSSGPNVNGGNNSGGGALFGLLLLLLINVTITNWQRRNR